MANRKTSCVLTIDQGTTSTRAMIVDHDGTIRSCGQVEHRQILPRPGWVEHDPREIWENVRLAIGQALSAAEVNAHDVAAVGITNQRETTIVWDRHTGKPISNAIVWQDTRTAHLCQELEAGHGPRRWADRVGLPLASYFSGPKIRWLLDHIPGARERAEAGELLFGTPDTWVLWNMTGGVDGGVHATDVTNASRTLLMDLHTLTWDEEICQEIGVPTAMLPQIKPSIGVFGHGSAQSLVEGVPIAGILGDQQAATFGQACFHESECKNTYGTGSFVLRNTGTTPVFSDTGMLTTLAYQIEDEPARYALEGSIAVTGSLVQWLRDNLGLITTAAEVETLARQADDNGGVFIVPAFSGLFAPHWRADARGAVVGLTRFVTAAHLARASLEATAYQTRDVLDAMQSPTESGSADSGSPQARPTELRVDGGMVVNRLLMQFQADLLGIDVVVPAEKETTALGAAYAAGIGVGFWEGIDDVRARWREGERYRPTMPAAERERLYRLWTKAVKRTLDWVDEDVEESGPSAASGPGAETGSTARSGAPS
ncbi:MAG: glycerol kinase GlpK [Bowdeniella nasicola]|nr:glycerol kinase GlpK [Bowdeniella nasicola]